MGLLSSLFSRSAPAHGAASDADSADNVAQARTRARQRLMGAVVLVGIGIIGFPLLFETQPRPIAVDVPIEIPRKETAAPLALPSARAPSVKAPVVPPPETARAPMPTAGDKPGARAGQGTEIITETAAEAGVLAASKPAVAATRPVANPDDTGEARAEAKPESKPESKPETKPQAKPVGKPAPTGNDAARAQALLDGKPAAPVPASTARFIVQIGAFADPALAQQTRLKVERLGLVTYTHVAQTADGARTRVRVGPVPTRQEADKVAAKLRAAGLPAAILTL